MGSQRESLSYNKQLVALELALRGLREEDTEEGLIRVTLGYLQSELPYALAWLGFYDRASHQLVGKGGNCATGDPSFFKQRFAVQPGGVLEQVLMQQRPIGIPNLQEEFKVGDWRLAARNFNIQGAVLLPICHKNTCLGVVLLGSALWGISSHAEEKTRLSIVLGELAKSLYLLDAEQQRQQAKRLNEPLLDLLPKLRAASQIPQGSLPNLQRQLEAIVDEIHRCVTPHRTSIYWYESKRRYFWKRLGNRGVGLMAREGKQTPEEISIQEVPSFYYAMGADQLISVNEVESLARTDQTGRLMQMIQARSLIAAPIIYQGELLGFVSVECSKARTWREEEINFVRRAAYLVGLVAPLHQIEETIRQVKLDQDLVVELSRALYSEEDWQNSLKKCAEQLCQRFKAERFLVLLYNKDLKKFGVAYRTQLPGKRRSTPDLEMLDPVDWQMLERSVEPIALENLDDELKLRAWRKLFLELGMRSLLVCSTSVGKPLEGLVIVGDAATRSWSSVERDLFQTVSQQIGLLTHQIQLQRQTDQLQKNYQAVQWGLTTLRQTQDLERLEQVATQQLAKILQAPLVALLTWQPGRTSARVVAPVVHQPQQFGLITDLLIPTQTDGLIQAALQADGLISLDRNEISPETRYWLSGSDIGPGSSLSAED